MILAPAASVAWLNCLRRVLQSRVEQDIKGALGPTTVVAEILYDTLCCDMRYPLVAVPMRGMKYDFTAAESLFVLSGSKSLDFHPRIKATFSKWSDDGVHVTGAYGPAFLDGLPYVLKTLFDDPLSRRAVINIFRHFGYPTKDTPCLVNLQYLIRDGRLHCIANMRSSDAWLGLPNDIFTFSMMTAWVCLHLRRHVNLQKLDVGTLCVNAGSRHIYEQDYEKATKTATAEIFDNVSPFSVDRFPRPVSFTNYLSDASYSSSSEDAFKLLAYFRELEF